VLDRLADEVACVFWDRQAGLAEVDIRIFTGGGSRMSRLKVACTDHAVDWAHTLWAMPDESSTDDDTWLVFQLVRRRAEFRMRMPSRASAEMWMIHHGPKL
jgi:hypothetical protein